jgi:hypothetical protein
MLELLMMIKVDHLLLQSLMVWHFIKEDSRTIYQELVMDQQQEVSQLLRVPKLLEILNVKTQLICQWLMDLLELDLHLFAQKNCSIIKPLELYGDGYYSDDSMICPAAIHQGVLSDEGGEVRVRIEKGLKAYHAI